MAKTEIIHVAVDPAMRKALQKMAKVEGLSKSVIIRIALQRLLVEGRIYDPHP